MEQQEGAGPAASVYITAARSPGDRVPPPPTASSDPSVPTLPARTPAYQQRGSSAAQRPGSGRSLPASGYEGPCRALTQCTGHTRGCPRGCPTGKSSGTMLLLTLACEALGTPGATLQVRLYRLRTRHTGQGQLLSWLRSGLSLTLPSGLSRPSLPPGHINGCLLYTSDAADEERLV